MSQKEDKFRFLGGCKGGNDSPGELRGDAFVCNDLAVEESVDFPPRMGGDVGM